MDVPSTFDVSDLIWLYHKYAKEGVSFEINTSYGVRTELLGFFQVSEAAWGEAGNNERVWDRLSGLFDNAMNEVYSLLLNSYGRLKVDEEFRKVAQVTVTTLL